MTEGSLSASAPTDIGATTLWPWLCFAALCAAILVACNSTVTHLVHVWKTSETYAHCGLIPLLSGWMLYHSRETRQGLRVQPSAWGLLCGVVAGAAWLLGSLAEVQVVQQLALVTLVLSAALTCFGMAWCRAAAFPLSFLFMAVPLGQELTPSLVELTADFVVSAVEMTGIPIYREGNSFIIPTGRWSVVSGCSGVRYLMATLTVALLFGYLNYHSWQRRLAFLVIAAVVAVVANWLRAFGIVMIAHFSGMKLALGVDHFIYGWVFFGLVIFLLVSFGAWWREPLSSTVDDRITPRGAPDVHAPTRRIAVPLAFLLLLPVWPGLAYAVWHAAQPASRPAGLEALPVPSGWSLQSQPAKASWLPHFAGEPATAHLRGRTVLGQHFGIDIAWFPRQTQGHELVHAGHRLVHEKDRTWLVLRGKRLRVLPDGLPRVEETLLGERLGEGRLLVWQLGWVDGEFLNGALATSVASLRSLLRGRGNAAASVILHHEVADGASLAETRAQLRELLARSQPFLAQQFALAAWPENP